MDWLTTLRRSGGINALARQIGSTPADVSAGAAALLPAVLAGLRQMGDRFGGGDAGFTRMLDALVQMGGGQLAADIMGPGSVDADRGKALLVKVIGPEVAQSAVITEAVRNNPVEQELMEPLLPALTMLVAGYITARAAGSGAERSDALGGLGTLRDSLMNDEGGEDRI